MAAPCFYCDEQRQAESRFYPAGIAGGHCDRRHGLCRCRLCHARLAALLESARARSRVSGVPVRWRATPDGFRFEGLVRSGQPDTDLPEDWLDQDTRVADSTSNTQATTLLLGPEPIIEPQSVVLTSRTQPGKSVRLATDGVRPFAVLADAP